MNFVGRLFRLIPFAGFYARELLIANLRLAWDAVTPTQHMQAAFIPLPLEARTDLEILVLGNLIAMTPGTLCLDVTRDRRTMYVHAMYAPDPEEALRQLQDFERRVLHLFR